MNFFRDKEILKLNTIQIENDANDMMQPGRKNIHE